MQSELPDQIGAQPSVGREASISFGPADVVVNTIVDNGLTAQPHAAQYGVHRELQHNGINGSELDGRDKKRKELDVESLVTDAKKMRQDETMEQIKTSEGMLDYDEDRIGDHARLQLSSDGSFKESMTVCEHGRRKSRCKECGGSSFCEHGRRKSRCKDCGGSSICEHGRRKAQCKECGGSSFCEHGRGKYRCKECKGARMCEHGKPTAGCPDCGATVAGIRMFGRPSRIAKGRI